ncbi:deoxyribonuclease-2 [Algoriphagus boseongensis]|uniref:Deoxyribonuclease-2 n=1 Tax=Algoriphagus boseongensis TaxID=1442587 RepID=A0A4R6TB71_9BACT|nr:deoxyribonuclease II family protein [Algoriphagus boseongensis]TDQ19483.1 deoxyribonuclease-2 [Algoriphagus boseongensis]
MLSPLSNQEGNPVDWWFIYKLPMKVGPKKDSSGFEFLYLDSSGKEIEFSKIGLDHPESALGLTLEKIFSDEKEIGYVAWNDEIPPTPKNPDPKNLNSKGHSKGVLAFSPNTNSGLYLLHSTPRFPEIGKSVLPENERKFGQTYICISLEFDEISKLADVIQTHIQGQVYASNLLGIDKNHPLVNLVENSNNLEEPTPSVLDLKSKKEVQFKHISKSKKWSEPDKVDSNGKDYWKDLVGPTLDCDLDVETWRRGMVFGDQDEKDSKTTEDIVDIDLSKAGFPGFSWTFDQDHSKWGFSCDNKSFWVVIADINRQVSQDKRGGGGLAFQNSTLKNFFEAITQVEKKFEKDIHKDNP